MGQTLITAQEILERLKALGDPEAVAGMARFGINPANTYGISIPALRKCAKDVRKNHELAHELWASGIHEARILASMTDDPAQVTPDQMEAWDVAEKDAPDEKFLRFLPIIERESTDKRNFVKKAVNRAAIETAQHIQQTNSTAARWIATDALREAVQERLQKRS
jgi:3-methyladenine DNA glycosylase AlkD